MTATATRAAEALLPAIQDLHARIRGAVVDACRVRAPESLSSVVADGEGDTIYAVDKVSEDVLLDGLGEVAAAHGGIVLIAEGIGGGSLTLPRGTSEREAAFRVIVDPIDGTRGLMYQKRSAWILTGVAPNAGPTTRLSDVVVAVQTEIPTVKQTLVDELWAVAGRGAHARRVDLRTGRATAFALGPSRAHGIEHGYAMLSRFFPGARDTLAAIDDELCAALLGPPTPGKARCFEDQYASTGGQLYELTVGHDRFNADLRPLLRHLPDGAARAAGLCCHPYDICTALIAREAGVILTAPDGGALDVPLDLETDVAWVGYANASLRARIEPVLRAALERRHLLPPLLPPLLPR